MEKYEKIQSVNKRALKDNGRFLSMSFENGNSQNTWRNRNRKVIWLNPNCENKYR